MSFPLKAAREGGGKRGRRITRPGTGGWVQKVMVRPRDRKKKKDKKKNGEAGKRKLRGPGQCKPKIGRKANDDGLRKYPPSRTGKKRRFLSGEGGAKC